MFFLNYLNIEAKKYQKELDLEMALIELHNKELSEEEYLEASPTKYFMSLILK